MNTLKRRFTTIAIFSAALIFTSSTFAKPDHLTGAGCNSYGVAETLAKHPTEVRFEAVYVSSWKIGKLCANASRSRVEGCYLPNGTAYLANKSEKLYWHEWCHAKFGPRHINPLYAKFLKPQPPVWLTQNG